MAWSPKQTPIMTRWARQVDPKKPWPEYPRPQLVRAEWLNLNGIWEYQPGAEGDAVPGGQKLASEILVPYPLSHPAPAVALHGAGSTLAGPLLNVVTLRYQQASLSKVRYQAIGSGMGYSKLQSGQLSFSISETPLSYYLSRSRVKAPQELMQIPVTTEVVGLLYNLPGLGPRLKLTGPIIADIYLGRIRYWDDPRIQSVNLGAHLPHLAIIPFHIRGYSGATRLFVNYLYSTSPGWRAAMGTKLPRRWPVTSSVRDAFSAFDLSPDQKGWIVYAWWLPPITSGGGIYCNIGNSGGRYVAPSEFTVSSSLKATVNKLLPNVEASIVNAPGNNSYPIVGYCYLFAPTNAPESKTRMLAQFEDYLLGPGQTIAKNLGYVPIPKEFVDLVKRQLMPR